MSVKVTALVDRKSKTLDPYDKAIDYYRRWKWEPSIDRKWDMEVQSVKSMSPPDLTVERILQHMNALPKSEAVLLVIHGGHEGFAYRMKGPKGGLLKDIKDISMAGDALEQAERIRNITNSKLRMQLWKVLIDSIKDDKKLNVDSMSESERDEWFKQWYEGQADMLSFADFDSLVKLRNRVAGKFKRIEIRGCWMGSNIHLLEALNIFFGADYVIAPVVEFFWGDITIGIGPAGFASLGQWDSCVPSVIGGGFGPNDCLMKEFPRPKGLTADDLRVAPLRKGSSIGFVGVGRTAKQIEQFLSKYIKPGAKYTTGKVPIVGLDTRTFGMLDQLAAPGQSSPRDFVTIPKKSDFKDLREHVFPNEPAYRRLLGYSMFGHY